MTRRRFLRSVAAGVAANALFPPEDLLAADDALSRMLPLPLTGTWAFRPDETGIGEQEHWATAPAKPGEGDWTAATVPGCWERDGQLATLIGPAWYRRDIVLPSPSIERGAGGEAGTRLWWECDAVSYHCEGYANGKKVGEHTGLWDAFAWEVPADAVRPDGTLPLALIVEKPGGKRFPIHETMAGFLPYVWGTWGGPWQEMRLRTTGPCRIAAVFAPANAKGAVSAEADVDLVSGATAVLLFALRDPLGHLVAEQQASAEKTGTVKAVLSVPKPELWEPDNPVLYTLTVTALVRGVPSDTQVRRVGFRDLGPAGEAILLNGHPVFFRAPLSWGWYETYRAPNPPPQVFADELARIRALGFNGMKLCLWVPPQAYFDIADEMGMLLWVELPMWQPEGTKFSREQTPGEYGRIVRQIGDHPSVALYTIGCEIGQGVDADFLGDLYRGVKEQTKSALVRDNSGSAECYGGPLPEHADFWDFHLYCEAQFARPTFDAFAPRWRERQPFLFGEFCDQDALRDLPALMEKQNGETPWWAKADPKFNPLGVRWEYGVTTQLRRMKEENLLSRRADLRESSRHQALLTRKYTLELARSYPFMTGYVVTGLVDTPITTAGLFDDLGDARFTPTEFTPFNSDTVLIIEPDRRRDWTAGGDRPSFLDRYGVWSEEAVRRHIGISHYGQETAKAILRWAAHTARGGLVTQGEIAVGSLRPGTVTELGLIEFAAPKVGRAERLTIAATLTWEGGKKVTNAWDLWVYPKPAKAEARRVGLYDPGDHLAGFAEAIGITPVPLAAATGEPTDGKGRVPVLVATAWRPIMRDYVQGGGRLLLIQPCPSAENTGDGLPAVALPFWREAMRLFEPHGSWRDFPHEKRTDLCFYGLAADAAFEIEKVRAVLGPEAQIEQVLTRVDARSYLLHAYTLAARLGSGTLLLTTLRPQGGLGDQPSGLRRHVAGAHILRGWLDWLAAA
jgi:hypothetical protein